MLRTVGSAQGVLSNVSESSDVADGSANGRDDKRCLTEACLQQRSLASTCLTLRGRLNRSAAGLRSDGSDRQGRARGFVTGMLAICLSASLPKDARSVCKIPFVHHIHSQRQPPMPPLANEPSRRDGPDLHNPRLVCMVLRVIDESLLANTTRRRQSVDARLQERLCDHHQTSHPGGIVFCCVSRVMLSSRPACRSESWP
jgi:hypothetical protein